jgi:hypothetical protein
MVLVTIVTISILLIILAYVMRNASLIKQLDVNTIAGAASRVNVVESQTQTRLSMLQLVDNLEDVVMPSPGYADSDRTIDDQQTEPNNTINSLFDSTCQQHLETWNANVKNKINQFQSLNMLNEKITGKLYGKNGLDCIRPIPTTMETTTTETGVYKKSLIVKDVFYKTKPSNSHLTIERMPTGF